MQANGPAHEPGSPAPSDWPRSRRASSRRAP